MKLYIILQLFVSTLALLPIENIPLYNHGIIYENLKSVKLELGQWTIRSTYDLQKVQMELKTMETFQDMLLTACGKLDSGMGIDCKRIQTEQIMISSEFFGLSNIVNSHCENYNKTLENSRVKRQIDFLGHIFKEITGVMDHDDSRRIDDDIKNLRANEDSLVNQLQKQTIAIDSIFEISNKTFSKVNDKLNAFSAAIDIYNKRSKEELVKNMVRNQFTELMGELNMIVTHLFKKKDVFLSLLATGNIPLTPEIYEPEKLLAELIKVEKILPLGFMFPVQINFRNIMKIYGISSVSSEVGNCHVEVSIKVPITNRLTYKAFKGTSVPIMKNGKFYVTSFENDVILKSENSSLGSSLTYKNYKMCKMVQDFRLCSSFHLLQNFTSSEDCNVQTFLNLSTNACVSQPLNLKHQLWIQMVNPNSWIYAIPNMTKLAIFTNGKSKAFELSGIGNLRINSPCLIQSGEIFLHYYPKDISVTQSDYFKIDFFHSPKEIKLLDDKVPDTLKHSVFTSVNEKDFFNEIVNLQNLNSNKIQLLDVTLEKHTLSIWIILLCILLAVGIFYLIFKYRFLLKIKSCGWRRAANRSTDSQLEIEFKNIQPLIDNVQVKQSFKDDDQIQQKSTEIDMIQGSSKNNKVEEKSKSCKIYMKN